MQVDLPSPRQSLSLNHTLKRNRSSSPTPSPTDQENNIHRPTKRPTLGIRIASGPASFRDSRRVEDWVHRTGGLHLDSPHLSCTDSAGPTSYANSTAPPSETGNDSSLQEETMIAEYDGPVPPFIITPPVNVYVDPAPSYPRPNSEPPSRPVPFSQARGGNSLAPPILSLQTNHLKPSTNPVGLAPEIRILPATPSSRLGGSSLPPSPMLISPSGSYISSPSSPNRKAKVTMGPRADCEKCRSGVKGHWLHYD